MQCPQCSESELFPVKLEPSLGASGCQTCSGTLLNLVSYRVWKERVPDAALSRGEVAIAPEEPGTAVLCPHCQRIMLRFRYTTDTRHMLDVCIHCEDVWLQEHEWEYLKSHSLHGDLPKIFTDPWQRRRRQARQQESLSDEWDERLGEELHQEIADLRTWLQTHPKRAELMNYLTIEDPYQV